MSRNYDRRPRKEDNYNRRSKVEEDYEKALSDLSKMTIKIREKDAQINRLQDYTNMLNKKLQKNSRKERELDEEMRLLGDPSSDFKNKLAKQADTILQMAQENQSLKEKILEQTKEANWRSSNIKALEQVIDLNHQQKMKAQLERDEKALEDNKMVAEIRMELGQYQQIINEKEDERKFYQAENQQLIEQTEQQKREIVHQQVTIQELQNKLKILEEEKNQRPIIFGRRIFTSTPGQIGEPRKVVQVEPRTSETLEMEQGPAITRPTSGRTVIPRRIPPPTTRARHMFASHRAPSNMEEQSTGGWPYSTRDEAAFWQHW